MTDSWVIPGLFLVGFLTGLRTMTPIAVLCWMATLGRVVTAAGWTGFVAHKISAGIFSVAALAEIVGDKLPSSPSRISPPGLIARIVFGGLCGVILASAKGYSIVAGALIGILGAVGGAFCGWFIRVRTVAALKCSDFPLAMLEDAVAVGGSILVWLRFGN